MLEAQDLDPELARCVLIEDAVRGVGVVVVAHAGVVAADYEVRASVVAADDGVEHRLLRSGVAHPRGVGRQKDAIGRVVAREQLFVAAHADSRGNVIALGFADERMQEQSIDALQRHLLQIFVRAVDRIARLEANHRPPPALRLDLSDLRRCQVVVGEA